MSASSATETTAPSHATQKPSLNPAFKTFIPLATGPTTPININMLASQLNNHPDKRACEFILSGLNSGFSLGCKSTILPCQPKNLQSALNNCEQVTNAFNKELARASIAGPFVSPPFSDLHCSPVGAREKPDGTFRIILDLSQPDQNSVNKGIDKEEYSVQYTQFDQATDLIMYVGQHSLLSKIDIQSAFRLLPVKPAEWYMLGMRWLNAYFIDCHLPFGCRSSPFIFNVFADLIAWIITNTTHVTNIVHYLDDYLLVSSDNTQLATKELTQVKNVFAKLHIPIAEDKLVGPVTKLTYLGIDIDTTNLTISLPEQKMRDLQTLLPIWTSKHKCTKKQLLSLIGKLSFATEIVRAGRTFLRRLINLSTTVSKLHHHITLNVDARRDIAWWIEFLPKWNGHSLVYDIHTTLATDLHLFTDASNVGFGIIYHQRWIAQTWPLCIANNTMYSIDFRELFAIYAAVATFSHEWVGKRLIFHTDNLTITQAWQKGTSKSTSLMPLIRTMLMNAAINNYSISFQHIPGVANRVADALSRQRLSEFRALVPDSELRETPVPTDLWEPYNH